MKTNKNPYIKNTLLEMKFRNPKYSKREIIENPIIQTLNTLRGRIPESLDSHWIKLPNKIIRDMGMKVHNPYEFRLILVKK